MQHIVRGGIIEAVSNAMEAAKKAKKGETDTETEDDTEKPDTSKASSYYGVVVCNPDESGAFTAYNLHVKVMFQNGKSLQFPMCTGMEIPRMILILQRRFPQQ